MTYRNKAILDLAQLAPGCMVPGCGAVNHGQVVPMHSNQGRDGKGMAIKASDAAIAFGCAACHQIIDQGSQDGAIRLEMWEGAHRATMRWLIESGHLVASVVPQMPEPAPPKPKAKIAKGPKLKGRGFDKPAAKRAWPKRAL